MKLQNPGQTVAVVVGIERYADPNWTDLHGPAMDALRFAKWLEEEGVPRANIQLHLSLAGIADPQLNEERDRLLTHYLSVEGGARPDPIPATRHAIENATNPLSLGARAAGAGESTLILYFSGHGLCSESKFQRYAIMQDAASDNMNVLDLTLLAQVLRRHPATGRYTDQWLIFDACAQDVGRHKLICRAGDPPDNAGWGVRQCFLCATRPGEFGYTSNEMQASAFTAELLSVLKTRTLDGLDVKSLFDALSQAFKNKNQHPTLSIFDEYGSAHTIGPKKNRSDPSLDELAQILSGLDGVPVDLLRAVFRDVTHAIDRIPDNYEEFVYALDGYVRTDDSGLSNAASFAIRLRDQCGRWPANLSYSAAGATLEQWIKAFPGKMAGPSVRSLELLLKNQRAEAAGVPTVILHLNENEPDGETRCWYYRGNALVDAEPVPTPATTLRDRLIEALTAVCSRGWLAGEDTIVELVLPYAVLFERYESLSVSIDHAFTDYRLGARPALLALRVGERWTKKEWQRGWLTRWRRFQEMGPVCADLRWLDLPAVPQTSPATWIGVRGALHPGWIRFLNMQLFQGALFVMWCTGAEQTAVSAKFNQNAHKSRLELIQSLSDFNDGAASLTCLIDEPERVPLGAGLQSAQLQQPTSG